MREVLGASLLICDTIVLSRAEKPRGRDGERQRLWPMMRSSETAANQNTEGASKLREATPKSRNLGRAIRRRRRAKCSISAML